jgi:hypothetical protein
MQWDVGIQGVGVLLVMAVVFGLVVQLVWGRSHWPWLWPTAAVAGFAIGALVSEGWFGSATEEELQPNIDGVSFDETLLGLMLGALAVLAIRLGTRRRRHPWIGAGQRRTGSARLSGDQTTTGEGRRPGHESGRVVHHQPEGQPLTGAHDRDAVPDRRRRP